MNVNLLGCPCSRHYIFTLRIHQIFTVKNVLSCCRIPRESNPCPGIFSHVTKNHSLNIHSSSPVSGYIINFSVGNSAWGIPRMKNSTNSTPELIFRLLRETLASLLLDSCFKLLHKFPKVRWRQLRIITHTSFLLFLLNQRFKNFSIHSHHHITIHLDKPSVTVETSSLISNFRYKTFKSCII